MGRILVVDDESTIRRTLRFVLERAGFVVEEAVDGQDALDRLAARPADLVILDVMMPRKSGFDVLDAMRADATLQNCRVLMLTAKGQEEDRRQAFARGADEFRTKPFSPLAIAETARSLLQGAS